MRITRRNVGGVLAIATMALTAGAMPVQRQATPVTIEVYKTATCGCCAKWVDHLRAQGFATTTTNLDDLSAVKARYKVPGRAQSCHTAVVRGYVIEGHVPGADIRRLLKERPNILGLAVPGMPVGSPGMEGPGAQPYDVVSFDKQGQLRVFSTQGR